MLNLKRWIIEIVILSLLFAGIGYAAHETKFTGLRVTDLTASKAVVTDAEKDLASSATTATELGYLSGVSSGVQGQIDAKAPLASPALTGSPTVETSIDPDTADGATQGSASKEWSDAYYADGAILYFQNDQSVTLTSSATAVTCNKALIADNLAEYGTVYIDAGAMVPSTTNGAAAGTNEYGTNDIDFDYFAFDPGVTEERVQFKLVMPEDWDRSDATMKAKFYWADDTTGSAAETVEWGIKAGALANDVAIDTALGTAVTISDTVLASSDMHITSATAVIVVAQAQALGDMIVFEVFRNTDGTDNMDDDAWLFGVLFQYKKDNTVSAW